VWTYKPARFEVFTAVAMKNGVFWDVTPCGSTDPDEGGEKFLRNVGSSRTTRRNIPEDTILHTNLQLS
jgi:hypothetical protein